SITDALRAAAAANVAVYAIDPRGSRNPARLGTSAESSAATTGALSRGRISAGVGSNFFDAMHALADGTGGFSMANSENFKNAFERITLEMNQYYLLGYYSTNREGTVLRQN